MTRKGQLGDTTATTKRAKISLGRSSPSLPVAINQYQKQNSVATIDFITYLRVSASQLPCWLALYSFGG
jgi:hypothetical protein